MARSIAERAVCEECGVDVRENTYFCYNCGTSIVEPQSEVGKIGKTAAEDEIEFVPVGKPDNFSDVSAVDKINSKGKAALDHLAEQISIDLEPDDEKAIARAAARRRRARSLKQKGAEFVWESTEDPPGRLLLLLVGVIVLLAGVAVVTTVIWK